MACGFELAAVAGDRSIYCPLPRVGWFPEEDRGDGLPGDPPDEPPALPPDAPMEDRVDVITAVLGASDATAAR